MTGRIEGRAQPPRPIQIDDSRPGVYNRRLPPERPISKRRQPRKVRCPVAQAPKQAKDTIEPRGTT